MNYDITGRVATPQQPFQLGEAFVSAWPFFLALLATAALAGALVWLVRPRTAPCTRRPWLPDSPLVPPTRWGVTLAVACVCALLIEIVTLFARAQ